jgi:hypothetical protein
VPTGEWNLEILGQLSLHTKKLLKGTGSLSTAVGRQFRKAKLGLVGRKGGMRRGRVTKKIWLSERTKRGALHTLKQQGRTVLIVKDF